MAKTKTTFFCQNCGTQHAKWIGQCGACKEWNTIVEEVIQTAEKRVWKQAKTAKQTINKPLKIADIVLNPEERVVTNNNELDTVLGGGLVKGSVTLLGGEPGIGKSTLLLQVALNISQKVLYVSGEESQSQIKMRAERLAAQNSNCLILTETNTQQIFKNIEETEPEVLVIDSIQTLHTNSIEASPGSISQIRETSAELIKFAKETATPVLLIGHINKEGNIAGPKILEHMVDVVLQFEGDRNHTYRILRSQKNRFGSTSELGIYEMLSNGLREITNPSEILISKKDADLSGTAIASTLEGVRPLMIEIQALVSTAVYGTPQRSTTGYNLKRLNMLLAVLEKRAGFKLGAKDVFLNITGGINVDDPAIDLAVVAGFLTQEQSDSHKAYNYYKNEYKNAVADGRYDDAETFKEKYELEQDYSFDRAKAKTANYACVYGAGGATVARGADISKAEGEALVKKYWERNWAVEKVAEERKVKKCLNSSWLFNPVSKFWYSLRTEKDRFSTLNQGTGVYCFDVWIKNFMKVRPQLTGQMHDEVILTIKKGDIASVLYKTANDNFDYVDLVVSNDFAGQAPATYSLAGGTTLGNTQGDQHIAVSTILSSNDAARINSSDIDMIFSWLYSTNGKYINCL